MATASIPEPPLAPVTATGPSPGRSPCSASRWIARGAVSPAVPRAIASSPVRPSGTGTTQSAGTRSQSAHPPSWSSDIPKPVTTTRVPGGTAGSPDSTTTPAASIPSVSGCRRSTGARPVAASASL